MPNPRIVKILGIDFNNSSSKNVVEKLKTGGLLVVPSGPGLASVIHDYEYYYSLLSADCVLADSGYMALLWNFTHKKKITRISGLEFLTDFFSDTEVRSTKEIMLVDPNETESIANAQYLNSIGFSLGKDASYIAPRYDRENVKDEVLLTIIAARKPKYILINLGGGIQEKLGRFLKTELNYRPTIICTGAAIAFLTGHQVHIPKWADRLFIGWLFRCIEKPAIYVPRYFNSFKLLLILLKYNANMPTNYLKAMPAIEVGNEFPSRLSIE